MANEPERPIEKLLRAAAKKRRDDAGAPFELHPADRRLLQGEVARKFAQPERESRSFAELLGQLWPRFAGGVAILAVLALAVRVLLPVPRNDKSEALLARNLPVSKDMLAQEPLPAATPAPATLPRRPRPPANTQPALVASADTTPPARPDAARQLEVWQSPAAAESALHGLRARKQETALAAAPKPSDRLESARRCSPPPPEAPPHPGRGRQWCLEQRYGSPANQAHPQPANSPAAPAAIAVTPTTAGVPPPIVSD